MKPVVMIALGLSTILISLSLRAQTILKSLNDSSVVSLVELAKNRDVLFMVFKKDCVPCKKQIKQLSCLKKKRDVVLIGSFGSESSLRNEYLKYKMPYPGYYMSVGELNELGISEQITPQMIDLKTKRIFLGFLTCKNLYQKLGGKS